jgi:hypothetical protein
MDAAETDAAADLTNAANGSTTSDLNDERNFDGFTVIDAVCEGNATIGSSSVNDDDDDDEEEDDEDDDDEEDEGES